MIPSEHVVADFNLNKVTKWGHMYFNLFAHEPATMSSTRGVSC